MKRKTLRSMLLTSILAFTLLIPHQASAAQSWKEWFWSNKGVALLAAGAVSALAASYWWWRNDPLQTKEREKYMRFLKEQYPNQGQGSIALSWYKGQFKKLKIDDDRLYHTFFKLYYPSIYANLTNKPAALVNIATERTNLITFLKEEKFLPEDISKLLTAYVNLNPKIEDSNKKKTLNAVNATIEKIFAAQKLTAKIVPQSNPGVPYSALKLEVGEYNNKGKRSRMEDTFIIDINRTKNDAFFAIFDGHGGDVTANYLADPKKGLNVEFFNQKIDVDEPASVKKFFADYDSTYLKGFEHNGATAVVFILKGIQGYFINLGDSAAYLIRDNQVSKKTTPHTPSTPSEKKRIEDAGSFVEVNKSSSSSKLRVEGNLEVSRALGDYAYKNPGAKNEKTREVYKAPPISNEPDITPLGTIQPGDTILLMCDGVSEYVSADEILEILKAHTGAKDIAKALVNKASNNKSGDNMSVIVIHVK